MNIPDRTRRSPPPTASGALTRLACRQAKTAGIDVAPILSKSGLSLRQVADPAARLRAKDQIRFFNLIADALQDELFGFHLGLRTDLREIGWLFYVLASSETMGQALQRGDRYSSIVNEAVSLQYVDQIENTVAIHYVGVSRHTDMHQIEFISTVLVRVFRQLTGIWLVPARLRFIHRRRGATSEFFEFFGRTVEFGSAGDEITFGAGCASHPVISADPYLNRLLISCCEEALSRRPGGRGSFRFEVENAIAPLLPHGRTRAGEIASRLGLTERTFARRLALEGVTFSGILERLRTDLAMRYLADSDLSISEIAWLLGYQEVSAFTHAFKRWTGKTPREARFRAGVSG